MLRALTFSAVALTTACIACLLTGCVDRSVPLPAPLSPATTPKAYAPDGSLDETPDEPPSDPGGVEDSGQPAAEGDSPESPSSDDPNPEGSSDAADKTGENTDDNTDANTDDKAKDETPATGQDATNEPANESPAGKGGQEEGQSSSVDEPTGNPLKTERVVLFTSKGPLLIEMQLAIDSEPHDQALNKLIDYVLKEADSNGDGRPTWAELTENPKFMYGQLGNAELNTSQMRSSAIQLYDVIRNGRVEASEVPRFLTRNAGGSRSFDFRSANYYRDIQKSDSPVLQLLDANEDGRIDYDEADRAAIRLQSRDADSDGILLLDELMPATDDRPGPLTQRRVSAATSSAWLTEKTKWSNLLYAMEEQYMLGGSLEAVAFELDPSLFERLNKNDDQRIDKKEIPGLLEVEPHLRIEASFGRIDEKDKKPLVVAHFDERLESLGAELEVGLNRVTLRLPQGRILIFLKDQARERQVDQQARALLSQYDADNNLYLDEDEFPESAPGLMGGIEAYDADGDGKVYEKELIDYLANVRVAQRSQIHSRAGDLSDALFDALDTSSDGRLDGRENDNAAKVLRQLDFDNDGEIIVDEIPGSMALAIVRGDPQQSDVLFSIPIAQPEPPENAPRWFLRMDRNQDGAIAKGEFMGDESQFQSLDANRDGFIGADEVAPDEPNSEETNSEETTGDDEAKEPATESSAIEPSEATIDEASKSESNADEGNADSKTLEKDASRSETASDADNDTK